MEHFHLIEPGRVILLSEDYRIIERVCKAWKLMSRQRKSMPTGKKYRTKILRYYKCLTTFPDVLHVDVEDVSLICKPPMKSLSLIWNYVFEDADLSQGKSKINNILTPLLRQYNVSGNSRLLELTSLVSVKSWGTGSYGAYQRRYKTPCKFSMTRDSLTLNDISAGYMRDIIQLWRQYICLSGTITIRIEVGDIVVDDYFFACCNYLSNNRVGPDLLIIDARSKVPIRYDKWSLCLDGLKHVKRIEIWTTIQRKNMSHLSYSDESFVTHFIPKYRQRIEKDRTPMVDGEFYDLLFDKKSWISLVYKPL